MEEKIGLLYRVSSKPQETDGGSLDVQREMGKNVSKKLEIPFVEFDEGVQSSYNVEVNLRPKLVELLDSIQKKNGIRKVWVFNTDRLGRTSQSWYSILKVFLDYNVKIYIGEDYNKPFDLTNSVDKLTIGVLTLISQYDNELRRLRSVIGKRNSLKSGNTYLGSTIPFGYSVKNKKLIINDLESNYVQEIYRMYDEGKSTMNIKIFLDRQLGIKPRLTKGGWNMGTIQKMMRNPLYKGEQTWEWKEKTPDNEIVIVESIKINTPIIIDEDLWKKVNGKMNLNLRNNTNKKSENNSTLLKGVLKCSKCGLFLNHRFRETNHYYCRSSEYNWKSNVKSNNKSKCGIVKSLRIEETDDKILNTVIDVVRNSKILREEYKVKNLSPKWEDVRELKKKISTMKKYLNGKLNEKQNCENEIIQIEFEVRTKKMKSTMGEKLKLKFQDNLTMLETDIQKIQKDLNLISNSKNWVNWIDKMSKEIDKIPNSSLDVKKEFIHNNIQEIDVDFDKNSNSHKLNITFRYPIVGDIFQYELNGEKDEKGFNKYQITEGSFNQFVEIPLISSRKKQNEKTREKLNNEIIRLKETEGFSLQIICDELNRMKLYSPTNKKWDKPKLSSYYKNLKVVVPKK